MALIVVDTGYLTVTVKHVERLASGTYRYFRRIPKALQSHYSGQTHRKIGLNTKDPVVAARKAEKLARQDDLLWATLISPEGQELGLTTKENREGALGLLAALGLPEGALAERPGPNWEPGDPDPSAGVVEALDDYFEKKYGYAYAGVRDERGWSPALSELLTPLERDALRLLKERPGQKRVLLSDATDEYLKLHKRGREERFAADVKRAVGHVYEFAGDLPLEAYKREHANAVRDGLLSTGNRTATVRRRLSAIVAVFNVGKREFDRGNIPNPFEGLKIVDEESDAEKRLPFTAEEHKVVAEACLSQDDDIRWLVGLLMDTGARLGEIAGLRVEDVAFGDAVPHIAIRPHLKLGRTLKNAASERRVPLVGMALWAARQALETAQRRDKAEGWLFPRYAKDNALKPTHASNTINKWLREALKIDKTAHSFRHAMRDRLRKAEVPTEIQDRIGGWGHITVGQGYGEGYPLEVLQRHMTRAVEG